MLCASCCTQVCASISASALRVSFYASCPAHILCARCSLQVALCKCSAQVAALRTLPTQWPYASCSAPMAQRAVLCANYSAQVSQRECRCASAPRKLLSESLHVALRECSVQVCLRKLRLSAGKLRFSSSAGYESTSLLLYLKVAISRMELRENASRLTSVLRGQRERLYSFCTPTAPISAEFLGIPRRSPQRVAIQPDDTPLPPEEYVYQESSLSKLHQKLHSC